MTYRGDINENAVGREIPDELLVNNKRVYSGKNQIDGQYEQKVGPKRRIGEKPRENKLVGYSSGSL